jgi:uncharacterized protein YjbI with pentapeptide repeats
MTLLSWRSLFTATATVVLVASAAAHADVLTRTNAREAARRLTAATCPKPTGKNFAGQNLADHNFHAEAPGSLRGANFEGAILRGAAFDGQDLTGASFKGADLGPSPSASATFANATLENVCFIDATLNATDFTFATMKCTDFTGTSLMQANFGPQQKIEAGTNCRTNFSHAVLDVNAIDTEHWGKTDFTWTDFQNLSTATFNLAGGNIAGARLVGANFSGIDMTGADLSRVDFTDAKLLNAKMDNAALNGAILLRADMSYATLRCARFFGRSKDDGDNPNGRLCTATPESKEPYVSAVLNQAVMVGVDLTHATLNKATLRAAKLSTATLHGTSFIEAWLESGDNFNAATMAAADLAGADFTRAHLNFVQFDSLVMPSVKFDETTLNTTNFTGSIMPLASFRRALLQEVNFTRTVLQGAHFENATLKKAPSNEGNGVSFTCADLGGASFANATVLAANFEGAIMPPESECCKFRESEYWCGTIDATQSPYGGVRYPQMQSPVTCPNGKFAACTGADWMIPRWRTGVCNSGVERLVWAKPDCKSDPTDYVVFKDDKLKKCILESLPGPPAGITTATAKKMTHVSCSARGITDLGGLEKFESLVSLDLSGNALQRFALPLKNLRSLKIAGNQLTSLDLGKTKVMHLDASHNKLTQIIGLGAINFAVLDVSGNALTDFQLTIQDQLLYADLSNNALKNVLDEDNTSLERLEKLVYLDLSHNALTTIGSAKSIAAGKSNPGGALETMFLGCNARFNCSTLALDGNYPAYQTSTCADFNTQTRKWVARQNPSCPDGP